MRGMRMGNVEFTSARCQGAVERISRQGARIVFAAGDPGFFKLKTSWRRLKKRETGKHAADAFGSRL